MAVPSVARRTVITTLAVKRRSSLPRRAIEPSQRPSRSVAAVMSAGNPVATSSAVYRIVEFIFPMTSSGSYP